MSRHVSDRGGRRWGGYARKLRFGLALAYLAARIPPHDMFNRKRAALYRAAGIRVGRDVEILGPLTLLWTWPMVADGVDVARFLEIGDNTAVETPCTISLCAPVRIGCRVSIGPEAMILTGTHRIGGSALRCGPYEYKPVEIGNGCWLGARVILLPGVRIGEGCVVAAGSVVSRSMPANSLISGNPARVIGRLEEAEPGSVVEG